MQSVTVDVTRSDLLAFQFRQLFTHPLNRITLAVIFVFCAVTPLLKRDIGDVTHIIAAVIVGLIAVAAVIVFSFVLVAGWTLLGRGAQRGCVGARTFTLTDQGLHERSELGESSLNWGSAASLTRTRRSFYIGINPSLFHIVPRRHFIDAAADEAFWVSLQRLGRKNP